jgi:ankyrin repeat protein
VLELLLAKGAEINARDTEGGATALYQAASWGRVEAVRTLLAGGADRALANKAGSTPLQAAIENGHTEVVALLRAEKTGAQTIR